MLMQSLVITYIGHRLIVGLTHLCKYENWLKIHKIIHSDNKKSHSYAAIV